MATSTIKNLNSKTTSTITADGGWTAGDPKTCTRTGNVVSLDYWCSYSGTPTARQWITVGTVPAGYRPSYAFDFVAVDNSGVTNGVQTKIESVGSIKVYLTDNRSVGLRIHATYIAG